MNENGKKRDREDGEGNEEKLIEEINTIDWQEQYEIIRKLNNETEKDLYDILELKKQSDLTFQQKIQLLEQKLIVTNNTVSNLSNKKMKIENDECIRLRKEIEIYQMLSGVKIDNTGTNTYLCTLKNEENVRQVKFGIKTLPNDKIEYEPIENCNLLPEYLQSNVEFDRQKGPVMLGDAILSLFLVNE